MQGDVIALVNSANGQIVARYDYDAWGKPIAITDANGVAITDQSHIAHVNPFRYRGYYYDNETGLYYLNTRYYDPEVGRFLNGDTQFDLKAGMNAYNLFTYCTNNPVIFLDVYGTEISTGKMLAYVAWWWNKRNPLYNDYTESGGDCANFISQVLAAGGVPMNATWKNEITESGKIETTTAWRSASAQYEYFKTTKWFFWEITIKTYDELKAILKGDKIVLRVGDLCYFTWRGNNNINHASIITGVSNETAYYAAHTTDRLARDLRTVLDSGDTVHLLFMFWTR